MCNCGDKDIKPVEIPYIVHESAEQRHWRREKVHWVMHFFCVLVIGGMMWNFFQYDTVSVSQDGEGTNIGVVGSQNEVTADGAKDTSANEKKQ